ncbi:MAG TPA: hypothetical protein DEH25_05435 [Chloroflexi bacterium]|nr:hypothetical protein [Chloroflexota bacterium]HBY08907.1 hypothetical protein [Chloroflexota bacterium]
MALLGWLRFIEVLRQWKYLLDLSPAPPVLYLALTGLIWGLAGSALVWGLVLGSSWAPRFLQITAILYTLAYWADRLLLADPTAIATRWPFALSLNLALLALSFWVLLRPQTRQYFHPVEPDRF